ncbi:hypothetical protein, partial [Thiolapillus sp.]|uniref:hypothetical protein n=1 Tax=Thiolapillus sp. TaxID=2017437 RepID=UPI003AF58F01
RSEAYFVFPLAQGTPGKQCGLAATGVYQPSLRSPWLAASVPANMAIFATFICATLFCEILWIPQKRPVCRPSSFFHLLKQKKCF